MICEDVLFVSVSNVDNDPVLAPDPPLATHLQIPRLSADADPWQTACYSSPKSAFGSGLPGLCTSPIFPGQENYSDQRHASGNSRRKRKPNLAASDISTSSGPSKIIR